jgi:NADH-quinone oxidoreductase subunit M
MYFLIGYFGGKNREFASIKFFIYTFFGSLLILIAMLALNLSYSSSLNELIYTFDVTIWMDKTKIIHGSILDIQRNPLIWGINARTWAFSLLIFGFAIKIPLVPFHTWLPDAHVEAPAPVSAILAGILLKIGGYGIMRFAVPIFPDIAINLSYFMGAMGLLSIIYGALCALAQTNLKRLIAYSSISHMGFVMLGIASCTMEGFIGATYQMISHGLISTLLFLLVGVLYSRTQDYLIDNYRGLMKTIPSFTGIFIIAIFAGMGLPIFSGFIGELLILIGTFRSQQAIEVLPEWMVLVAIFGIVLSSGYFLWAFQRMFFGTPWWQSQTNISHIIKDLSFREWAVFLPICLLILFFGIYPQPLITLIEPASQAILKQF